MYKRLNLCRQSAFLIENSVDRKFFVGYDFPDGFAFICERSAYFIDARYFFAVKDKISEMGFVPVLYNGIFSLKTYAESVGVKKLGVDFDKTTVSFYNLLKENFLEIFDCSEQLKAVRSVKTEEEIGFIKKACDIALCSYKKAVSRLKAGVTEREIKEAIESEFISLGAERPSFDTIVAFGANSAVPHHETSDTKLENNSTVLIDTGCVYKGYCSDLTRTLFFGTPDEKFIKAYRAVQKANESVERNFGSGAIISDLHNFAVSVLEEDKLGKFFTHSLGHGVGLEIHEAPTINAKNPSELKTGTVFTVEPGVYLDGEFGVRIEDTVVVTENGIKRLFDDSKDFVIIK